LPQAERNPEACEEYLHGMYIWQCEPDLLESLNQARERFEASLASDDHYADAHWGLFRVWDRMHRNARGPLEQSLAQMQSRVEVLVSHADTLTTLAQYEKALEWLGKSGSE
jgi:hypothetical protein